MSGPATRPASAPRASTPAGAAAASARFAARARSRRRSRWLRIGIGVVAAAVVAAAVWALWFSPALAVRSVDVAGADRLTAAAVKEAARVPTGGPLMRLDTGAIAARVRALAPVAEVDVARAWPHTVRITVTERRPAAILATARGRRLVDAEGVAFAPAAGEGTGGAVPGGVVPDGPGAAPAVGLPILRTTKDELPPAVLVDAQEMLAALPASIREQVRETQVDSADEMTVELRDGRQIAWGGPGQAAFKSEVLLLLFTEAQTKGARAYDVSVPEAPVVHRR